MIRITIGDSERLLEQVAPSWLHQQIDGRREVGEKVCVRVSIKTGNLDMLLSTPECASSGGGGRRPNRDEQKLFDLWEKRGLNSNNFIVGQLNAFLNEIKHV